MRVSTIGRLYTSWWALVLDVSTQWTIVLYYVIAAYNWTFPYVIECQLDVITRRM